MWKDYHDIQTYWKIISITDDFQLSLHNSWRKTGLKKLNWNYDSYSDTIFKE